MKKSFVFLALLLLIGIGNLQAQTVRITGTVRSVEDGNPIPGVSVFVKGATSIGVTTNINGQFTIKNLPANAKTLVFRFVGFQTKEVAITGGEINVTLDSENQKIEEVVVTALGIKKDRKKLGYNVQELKGDELLKSRQSNVVNSLSGKVAGAMINQSSGEVGASTSIVLRGLKSLKGNNQPLFIIDGIPFSNNVSSSGSGNINNGIDYGNGAMDVSPDDIESLSTLTGAAASALYGSRAANGAIVITTKSGKNKKGVGISYSYDVSMKNPFILPKLQNSYGQGQLNTSSGKYEFEYVDGKGNGTFDDYDESWGPALDQGLMIKQFWSKGVAAPWVSHPNNIKDFFRTGVSQSHNVSFDLAKDGLVARFAYSNTTEKGMVPNTDYSKHNFLVNTEMKMTNKLTINAKINYSIDNSDNRNGTGYAGDGGRNVFNNIIWSARQVDFNSQLKDYWADKANLKQYNWNSAYWNNPYFMLYENTNGFNRNRINGMVKADYKFSENLTGFVRLGNDYYVDIKKEKTSMATLGDPDGNYWEDHSSFNEINADFLFTYKRSIFKDVNLSASIGGNIMDQKSTEQGLSIKSFVLPDIWGTGAAGASGSKDYSTWNSHKQIRSAYAIFDAELPKGVNVNYTYRVDQSSTLPVNNNTYSYYSANLAWLVNKAFQLPDIIDLAKIRVSYAQVGNDTDPYNLRPVFNAGGTSFPGVPSYTLSTVLKNPDLKPEITKSFEIGGEVRLFKNRIGIDVSYYDARTTNQILAVQQSTASGFGSKMENIGTIANKGIEATLNLGIIRGATDGFSWNMDLTYGTNKSEVIKLNDSKQQVILSSWWSNSRVVAAEGMPYGTIMGKDFKRNKNGQILVGDNGFPTALVDTVLGHVQPDFNFGITNSVSYKSFDLQFLIGGSIGGEQYSIFKQSGCAAGQLEESLQGREYTVLGDVDQQKKGYIIDGVNATTGEKNTVGVRAWDYWKQGDYQKNWIIDASYVKLKSASLGYTFNTKIFGINSLRLSVYGNNLMMLYSPFKHYDVEQTIGSGNVSTLGYSYAQTPTARIFGFNLKVNF